MNTEKKEQGGMVGFRLNAKHIKKLSARASRAGTSHHQQAQAIVEAALDEREEEAMLTRIELADLRAEVEAIRAGLVAVFSNLMANASNGKVTLDNAKSAVEVAFTRKGAR